MKQNQIIKQVFDSFSGRRGSLFLIAVVLALIVAVVWIFDPFATSTNAWVVGTLGKVVICLVALFFAWPSIQKLRRLPGGSTISAIGSVLVALMIARPRMAIYILPFAVIVGLVLISLQWSSDKLKRRGKK